MQKFGGTMYSMQSFRRLGDSERIPLPLLNAWGLEVF